MKSSQVERLQQLGELREKGVLTEEEFAAQKAALMGDGTGAPSGEGRRTLVIVGVVALLLIAGAAVGAYFYGQSTRDEEAARKGGYAAGFANGGEQMKMNYGAGGDGYLPIWKDGYRQGKKDGKAVGREAGYKSGAKAGEASAFEGYDGGWDIGSWYLIKIGTGDAVGSSAKYSIPTRVGPMKDSLMYLMCDGNICTRPNE